MLLNSPYAIVPQTALASREHGEKPFIFSQ